MVEGWIGIIFDDSARGDVTRCSSEDVVSLAIVFKNIFITSRDRENCLNRFHSVEVIRSSEKHGKIAIQLQRAATLEDVLCSCIV